MRRQRGSRGRTHVRLFSYPKTDALARWRFKSWQEPTGDVKARALLPP
jgi:hypothetical protein